MNLFFEQNFGILKYLGVVLMIHGVVFYSPSRHLFTEILFCTLIDTDREIDTDRHQESFKNRITYPVVIRNSGHHPEARPALHRRTRNRLSKTIGFGPQNIGPDVVVIFSYKSEEKKPVSTVCRTHVSSIELEFGFVQGMQLVGGKRKKVCCASGVD